MGTVRTISGPFEDDKDNNLFFQEFVQNQGIFSRSQEVCSPICESAKSVTYRPASSRSCAVSGKSLSSSVKWGMTSLFPRPRSRVIKVICVKQLAAGPGVCQGLFNVFIHVFVLVQNEGHVMHGVCGID